MSATQQQSAPATERGALVIRHALKLMRAGKSKGWSDALAQAEKQVT